jgi:hypothetical protein
VIHVKQDKTLVIGQSEPCGRVHLGEMLATSTLHENSESARRPRGWVGVVSYLCTST